MHTLYRFRWKDGYVDYRKVKSDLPVYRRHREDRDDRHGAENWLTFGLNLVPTRAMAFPVSDIAIFEKVYYSDYSVEFVEV